MSYQLQLLSVYEHGERSLLSKKEGYLSGGASLNHGNWEAATGVLGSCWYRDNSRLGWVRQGSSANSVLPLSPVSPCSWRVWKTALHFYFRPNITEFDQLNKRFHPADRQESNCCCDFTYFGILLFNSPINATSHGLE